MHHLYEVVLTNSRVWLKVQASCSSSDQAEAFFQSRFTGTDPLVDGNSTATSFKLSKRSDRLYNWPSVVNRLPVGWDDGEFHILGSPYPWCETLSEDCDCHGSKGRLDVAYCSDFGLHDEQDPRERKSENVRHAGHIHTMERIITQRDEARRNKHSQQEPTESLPGATTVLSPRPPESRADGGLVPRPLTPATREELDRLVASGFYCSIEGKHHPYGDWAIQTTIADLAAAHSQISAMPDKDRQLFTSWLPAIARHWLQMHQAEECAQRSIWGEAELPGILYKYIPKRLIGNGAPASLLATQLLALNDDMECNVLTMSDGDHGDSLSFLRVVQSKLEQHLGVAAPWEELLARRLRYGDLRMSTFIQEYLNPLVGIVSFSTDLLVPTMWAHYAKNTGIVVGYDTEALRALGFELRPVVYSEIAPVWQPSKDDTIRLDFVNREDVERDLRTGRTRKGTPLLTRAPLAPLGADWKLLSRLLLVKGSSWAYEKEVRLLVDQEQTRDTGKNDANGWPVRVLDLPPDAIREIYRGPNTQEADVERAVRVARGEDERGLFVGRLSSHAFRIEKSGGTRD